MVASVIIQFLCEMLFMTEIFVTENYLNRSNILYSMAFFLTGGMLYLYRIEIEQFVKGKCERQCRIRQWCILFVCIIATIVYYLTPDMLFSISINDQKVLLVFTLWCVYAIGAKSVVLNNSVVKLISKYSMEIYLSHMIVLKVLRTLKVTEITEKNVLSFIIMFALLLIVTLVFVLFVNYGIACIRRKIKNIC